MEVERDFLTLREAAERWGVKPELMRRVLDRERVTVYRRRADRKRNWYRKVDIDRLYRLRAQR